MLYFPSFKDLNSILWPFIIIIDTAIKLMADMQTIYNVMSNIPTWLVANCISMLSWESMKGAAIMPALLLNQEKIILILTIKLQNSS